MLLVYVAVPGGLVLAALSACANARGARQRQRVDAGGAPVPEAPMPPPGWKQVITCAGFTFFCLFWIGLAAVADRFP